jgi:hypothetical protein
MRYVMVLLAAVAVLSGCSRTDPTDDRPGEWRTVTSPSGQTYECYVVAGYRTVAVECFEVSP